MINCSNSPRYLTLTGFQTLLGFKVYLLLFGLVLLLSACVREDAGNGVTDPDPLTGELITVNFTVSDTGFDESEVTTRSSQLPLPLSTTPTPLDHPYPSKGGELEENDDSAPVGLRAAVYLDPGIRVRIVAYLCTLIDTTYASHADYEVLYNDMLTPLNPPGLALPDGDYKFVAYSFNNMLPLNPPFAPVLTTIPPTMDLMWGFALASVSLSSVNVHITMNHLFSKVTVDATLVNQGFLSVIDTIRGASIAAMLPDMNVKTGELSVVSSNTGAFTWIPGSAAYRISNPLYVYTNGAANTQLEIDSLRIDGHKYDGPYNVTYTKPLEAGKAYRLRLFFYYVYGGSADRITIDNTGSSPKLAITRDATDKGLFFKFGGVVGIQFFPNSFSLSDIVFNPLSNPGDITAFREAYSLSFNETDIPAVPAYSEGDWDSGIRNISLDNYHNLANILIGKGDPCRLIGMTQNEIRGFTSNARLYEREAVLKAQGIGGWRTPTNLENQRFSGYTADTTTAVHWWTVANPSGVLGGEFPTRNSNNGSYDPTKFLPAWGYITNTGSMVSHAGSSVSVSATSFYWSSEPSDNLDRLSLEFSVNNISPSALVNQVQAHTVRCIRPQNSISVSLEDWIDDVGGYADIYVY